MKIQVSKEMRDKLMAYNWDSEDVCELLFDEFMFMYDKPVNAAIVEVTKNIVKAEFTTKIGTTICLQCNEQGFISIIR